MTKKNLMSKRMEVLEKAGIDTSKFSLTLNGINVDLSIADEYVEDKHISNAPDNRPWVTAQTFRMLYEPSYNAKTRKMEYGWDAYLINVHGYMYQFTMMLDEIDTLATLEKKDPEMFKDRSRFFTKDVVVNTCLDYVDKFMDYVNKNHNKGMVKLESKYGKCELKQVEVIIDTFYNVINDMQYHSDNYKDLYTFLKKFVKIMNKLPYDTPKCKAWKEAFKGNGAYYTLRNLVLSHEVVLRGCRGMNDSLAKLTECLETYKGEYWRFHYMLKDTIEYNDFDLKESIRRHS